jgi:(S)-ureidoglycine aminohydrolase
MASDRSIPSPSEYVAGCRAAFKPGEYIIVPQENRCGNPHLNLKDTDVQIFVTPRQGAGYLMGEYLVQPGGGTLQPFGDPLETFLFLIQGKLSLKVGGTQHELAEGGYAWIPPRQPFEFSALGQETHRLLWFRRPYLPLEGVPVPDAIIGNEKNVPAVPEVDLNPEKALLPYANPGLDLAFNLIEVPPGAFYGLVEQHAWEHAMYMLEGEGFLWLNGGFHHVKANDFIFIAPYVPEWFCAYGMQPGPVRFLLYWDWNRDYSESFTR